MFDTEDEILKNYIPALGPQGLKQVLEELLERSQKDADFAAKEHFIYYQIGEQRSLMKVDMSQKPILFWYFDLLGRPAPKNIKKVVTDFLWEKCGEKQACLQKLEFQE